MKIISAIFVLIFLSSLTSAQDSKGAACQSLVKCLSDADDARVQCDKQKKPATNSPTPKSDECSTIDAKTDAMQTLVNQRNQQQRDCLTSSAAEATPVGDKKKQDQCAKVVAAYQQPQPQANVGVGVSPNASANNHRLKRQVSNGGTSAATQSSAAAAGGTSPSSPGGTSAATPTQPATTGSTGSVGTLSSSASPSVTGGGGGSVGAGGSGASPTIGAGGAGNGVGNGAGSGGGAPPPKGRGPKGGNGHNGNADDPLKQCYQNVENKQKLCRDLYGCCSEVTPCDLKYQISPLHNQISQAQLDLFYLRRRCQQQKSKGNSSPTPGGGGGGVKGNATVAASAHN